jgi:translocator protein
MTSYDWYQTIIKPSWAPPGWVFGPVWSLLYIIIAITYGMVFYHVITKRLPWKTALPFALNLIFNLTFSPIQFGLKNNLLATLDILLIFSTLIWEMIIIYPRLRWIAISNIPYFFWVSFATALQLTITYLNF